MSLPSRILWVPPAIAGGSLSCRQRGCNASACALRYGFRRRRVAPSRMHIDMLADALDAVIVDLPPQVAFAYLPRRAPPFPSISSSSSPPYPHPHRFAVPIHILVIPPFVQ
eukprot:9504147-Pyramimonas_sp.AAC.4